MRELERASLFMIGDKDIRTYLSTGDKELLDDVYNTLIYLRNNSDYIKAIQIEARMGKCWPMVLCRLILPGLTGSVQMP